MENAVALSLFRKYGHDEENERVFFYNNNFEVDFYVPEDKLAIQVSYSIKESETTYSREIDALRKFAKAYECNRRVVITFDESEVIEDDFGMIEVVPCWRWMLGIRPATSRTGWLSRDSPYRLTGLLNKYKKKQH